MSYEKNIASDISFKEILNKIIVGYKIIIFFSLLFLLISAVYTRFHTRLFTAEMKVIPVDSVAATVPSSLTSLLGAGHGLPSSFVYFTELLRSSRVSQEVMRDPELMARMFKPAWQLQSNGQWLRVTRPGMKERASDAILRILGLPTDRAPSSVSVVQRYLAQNIKNSQKATSDVVTLSWTAKTPEDAQYFLSSIVSKVDRIMREEKERELESYIKYLDQSLESITQTDVRAQVVSRLLESQTKLVMLRSGAPYAVQFLDPAYASPIPTSPVPFINLSMGLVLGLLVGIYIAVTRS